MQHENKNATNAIIAADPFPDDQPARIGTFSRVTSHQLCLNSGLEFLTPYERITSRTISRQFASTIRSELSLWRKSVYQHDSAHTTPTPLIDQQKLDHPYNDLVVRSLPPEWLRSAVGGLLIRGCCNREIALVLPRFSSIRSLQIRSMRMSELHSAGSLRRALTALTRLEELRGEGYQDTLLCALFSFSDDRLSIDTSDELPAIWSFVSTLRRLELRNRLRSSDASAFLVFAWTMAQRTWIQLECLECVDFLEIVPQKLFTAECLPHLKHLTISGDRYANTDTNFTDSTGGVHLPHLKNLHHAIKIRRPAFGGFGVDLFGSPAAFGTFGTSAFGIPPAPGPSETFVSAAQPIAIAGATGQVLDGTALEEATSGSNGKKEPAAGSGDGEEQKDEIGGEQAAARVCDAASPPPFEFGATHSSNDGASTSVAPSAADSAADVFGVHTNIVGTATVPNEITPDSVDANAVSDTNAAAVEMDARAPSVLNTEARVEYSSGLLSLECHKDINWKSLAQLNRLTRLVLHEVETFPDSSLHLFESIGHHVLPHLATLSLPCSPEPVPTSIQDPESQKVLDLMSHMTSLTALHSRLVRRRDDSSFRWFEHLYQFPSLSQMALLLYNDQREYRIVPLPLPACVTLRPNQHRLYPNGGRDLPPLISTWGSFYFGQIEIDLPKWMRVDPSSTVDSATFVSPDEVHEPQVKFIDVDKFRESVQVEYETKLEEAKKAAIATTNLTDDEDESTNTIIAHIDHLTSAMTDLCMTMMLSYLPPLEIAQSQSVSQHFHRSVLHSTVWKNVQFRVSNVNKVPSLSISQLIGRLSIRAYNTPPSELDLIPHFPSLRRLELSIPRERHSDYTASASLRNDLGASPIRLESFELSIELIENETNRSKTNQWSRDEANKIWQLFFENDEEAEKSSEVRVKSLTTSLPIIYNYADSLKRLDLTIFFSSDDHVARAKAMNQRVWSALESLELEWIPLDKAVPHNQEFDPLFPSNAQLPFEYILTHLDELLPRLWCLELAIPPFDDLSIEFMPLASLNRIFTALSSSKVITRLDHSFSCLLDKSAPERVLFQPTYSVAIESLSIANQPVAWNQVAKLSSLTELRLGWVSNSLTPTQLFETIGNHSMPSLATLSSGCPRHEYSDVVVCTREFERVKKMMSQMTSLTQLHSPYVYYTDEVTPTSFCWFAHAYLFSSLERIEYLHNNGDSKFPLWSHTLLPVPLIQEGPEGHAIPIRHHLLPDPFNFQPPHIFCSVQSVVSRNNADFYQSITAQREYSHTSFEELHLDYLQHEEEEDEKEKEEAAVQSSRVSIPLLRDTRVKFAPSLPLSLLATSKDELQFTLISKKSAWPSSASVLSSSMIWV